MLYQAAKSELQSPPERVSWSALMIEVGAFVGATLGLLWLF